MASASGTSGSQLAPELPEIDMAQLDYWQDPHGVLTPARERSAVARAVPLPIPDLPVPWIVLRFSEVEALLADKRLRGDYGEPGDGTLARLKRGLLGSQEGAAHARLRGLVARAFTPRRIDEARPQMRAFARELLHALEAGTVVDFQTVADELTVRSICALLGVPEDDIARFGAWTGAFVPGANPIAPPEVRAEAERAAEALYAYVADLAERRRREPRDGLLDALIAAEEAGDRLSSNELQDMVLNLLIGGHDTVRSLLGIVALLVLRHPEVLTAVQSAPTIAADVVEEVLRFESPVMFVPRTANETICVDGTEIPDGGTLLLNITSANRDPRRFRDPDRFDFTRRERADLAFGRGVHFCLGAHLARAEAQELLCAWTDHGPRLELVEEPSWVPFAAISRRLQSLMVGVS